jgi:hypothetical protein
LQARKLAGYQADTGTSITDLISVAVPTITQPKIVIYTRASAEANKDNSASVWLELQPPRYIQFAQRMHAIPMYKEQKHGGRDGDYCLAV